MIIFHPSTQHRRIPNRKVLSSRNSDFYCSDVSAIAFFLHTISYFLFVFYTFSWIHYKIRIYDHPILAIVANVRKMSTQKLRSILTLFILFYLFSRAEPFLHGYVQFIFTHDNSEVYNGNSI